MSRLITIFLVCFSFQISTAKTEIMKDILIVYGSFSGSTATISDSMKSYLTAVNYKVTVIPAENKKVNLKDYDLIIIGSAIHGDAAHPNVINFVKQNEHELKNIKTAMFIVCGTITSTKESKRKNALTYPNQLTKNFTPISKIVFAGNMPSGSKFGNWLGKMILGITPGDYRDWGKIKEWTLSLVKHK
jgi:menaquinone-dependent protoporphyrinogen IX oxidase